jgi:hypothetical protein
MELQMAETLVARVSLSIGARAARSSGRANPRTQSCHSPKDYHRVTIELSGEGAQTHLSLTERGNTTERELAHSEGGWRMALGNMKALLEGTSVEPMR